MLSFEQIQPLLLYWGRKLSSNKFECWELINEVWLAGNVQKLDSMEYASHRIYFDMMHYIYHQCEKQKVNVPKMVSYHNKVRGTDICWKEFLEDRKASGYTKQFICKDACERLLQGLNQRSQVLIMLWAEGWSIAHIAGIFGMSKMWVHWKVKEIKRFIQKKALQLGISSSDIL